MKINLLTTLLDERNIAKEIGIPHDNVRIKFPLNSNTVDDFEEFKEVIASYFNHHYAQCLTGGTFSLPEAASRAKTIIEQEYRKRGGDIVTAYNDAHDGTNGGMRAILDIISDRLKTESVENYINDVFDSLVAPNSFEDKVDILAQFITAFGSHFSSSIQKERPERYAHDYKNLIRAYVMSLQNTSSMFRRL